MTTTPRQLRHLLQLNTAMLAFIIGGAGFVVLLWFDFCIFGKALKHLGWDGEGYRLSFMRKTEQMSLRAVLITKQEQDSFCNSRVNAALKKQLEKKKTVHSWHSYKIRLTSRLSANTWPRLHMKNNNYNKNKTLENSTYCPEMMLLKNTVAFCEGGVVTVGHFYPAITT